MTLHYEYEPWFTQDGQREIPCFTIYRDGEPIAWTNENRSQADQEDTARTLSLHV